MPKRILVPAWKGMTSPVTLKSVLLFLALVFIGYTLISDYNQRQASFERYKAIAQYTEDSRVAIEAANQTNEIAAKSTEITAGLLYQMGVLNESMRDIAEILRINRAAQKTEHEMMMRSARTSAPKKKDLNQRIAMN